MAKSPEFKNPQGVHVKTPESSLFGEAETPKIEWLDLPNPIALESTQLQTLCYPYSGQPVWLTPDGLTEFLAVWRVTREFKDGRFQPTAFWAMHNGGGVKIPFEPLGYRKYEEPLFVPKRRA